MHVPIATRVTRAAESVQIEVVCELKLTGNPEEAVALTVNGPAPNARLLRGPNVIAWVVGTAHVREALVLFVPLVPVLKVIEQSSVEKVEGRDI